MADPKPCPLCGSDAVVSPRTRRVTCSDEQPNHCCPMADTYFHADDWDAILRRPTVDELAEALAKIPPEMWAEAQDSNDERTAWRAIAEELSDAMIATRKAKP